MVRLSGKVLVVVVFFRSQEDDVDAYNLVLIILEALASGS